MKLMMTLFAVFQIAVCDLALACDKDTNSTPESTCVYVKRGASRGIWFELKTADELRQYKLQVPELKIQIESLEQMASIRDFQLERYKQALGVQEHALGVAKSGYEQAVKVAMVADENARAAQRELSAWYRSPALWTGIGAAAVALLVVALR